ncbi:QRFP-like peptide receptor isoform X2 [Actinia tenebrosa]|uniref:QRFP-like peptide receptor isoform X2 n=1 Tax=Actinia tenebrosa TaxID=6105 RepID=A0A6P8IZ50_ACTTE|nr:QRFP-like peptide receptor isoform X2 [Actinia tenebrosa]
MVAGFIDTVSAWNPNTTVQMSSNNTSTSAPPNTNRDNNTSCMAMALRVTFAIIAFLAVFGNFLVVVVLVKNRILKRHASAVVIFCLAVCDMATGIVLVFTPAFIIGDENIPVPSGLAGELYCRLVTSQYFVFTLGKISIAMIMFLAVERWYAVAKPVKYKTIFTRKRMSTYVVFICLACLILNGRALFEKVLVTNASKRMCKWVSLTSSEYFNRSYVITHSIITFYIPLVVTMAAFIHLFIIIRKQRGLTANVRQSAPVIQLLRMCFVTSLVLGLCWLPNQLVFVMIKFGVTKPDTPLHHATIVVSMLNSCANPWIYCATSRTFRRGFFGIFCGCRGNRVAIDSTEMTIAAANRLAHGDARRVGAGQDDKEEQKSTVPGLPTP